MMLTLLSYFSLFTVSAIAMIVLDDDPAAVSVEEWVLFAVMIYSAFSFFRTYRDLTK
ncbi:hypothetical protein RP726_00055 [Candidatus Methylospira mobilis]|uniref:hypothetical protein n=1 Tax=Candidatus Methylospira mobilis TaxID=1808979 RepID=UPI0012936EE5|nr:hypothetical protein [Candidatus Methylospira mobilis]WNV04828.1 hypothetical protein RP726_00055 [Candidatus Methylospira mobilis]